MRSPLSLINRILSGDKPDPTKANVPKSNPAEDFVRQVWGAPALYNRATRRRVRLFSRIWRWDTAGTEMQRTFVPRYIRRHYRGSSPTGTRRQRRHYARVVRLTQQKGLIS